MVEWKKTGLIEWRSDDGRAQILEHNSEYALILHGSDYRFMFKSLVDAQQHYDDMNNRWAIRERWAREGEELRKMRNRMRIESTKRLGIIEAAIEALEAEIGTPKYYTKDKKLLEDVLNRLIAARDCIRLNIGRWEPPRMEVD